MCRIFGNAYQYQQRIRNFAGARAEGVHVSGKRFGLANSLLGMLYMETKLVLTG